MGNLKVYIVLFGILFFQIKAIEIGGNRTCPTESLPCDDGECVSRGKWCDGQKNCQDESDEAYCMRKGWFGVDDPNSCNNTHFLCNRGQCIPLVGKCDGFEDCKDKSDEWNCEPETGDDYDDYFFPTTTSEAPMETTSTESSSVSDWLSQVTIKNTPSTKPTHQAIPYFHTWKAPSSPVLTTTKSDQQSTLQQPYNARQPSESRAQTYDSRRNPDHYLQQPYNARQPSESRPQTYDPRRNPQSSHPIFTKVIKGNERENSTTINEATPTRSTNCSDHNSSPVQQEDPFRGTVQKRKTEKSEAEKRIESALNFLQIFTEKPEKDELSAFCELLCIQLREMDANMRLVAMHEINSLIFRLKRAGHSAVDGDDA